MLTGLSRWLTYLTALLYAILGILLFLFPEALAPVFAWKVSGFVTITIGGWCLGNAWLAFLAARRWRWDRVYAALFYLWLFGALETGVVFLFISKLQLVHPVAWLYLATLALNVIAALFGMLDFLRTRPALASDDVALPRYLHWLNVAFVLYVGFLGYYGLTAQLGDPGTNAGIFPEVLSLFTLRSFGAFYLSLALATGTLLWAKSRESYLSHGWLSYGLIVFITLAAFVYLRVFNFEAHPSQIVYLATYLIVGVVVGLLLWKQGTGRAES